MKATAKYLFDEDFASGEKPTITLVEARAPARGCRSRRPIATALPLGRNRRKQEAAQRIAAALAVIADGLGRLDGALTGDRNSA